MTRKTGNVGHLSFEDRVAMKRFLADGVPTSQIMAQIGCNKQTVSEWRHRTGLGLPSRNSIQRPRIPHPCLVDECHEEAVDGKYCAIHQHACGQRGRDSQIPMSRLMGGRA